VPYLCCCLSCLLAYPLLLLPLLLLLLLLLLPQHQMNLSCQLGSNPPQAARCHASRRLSLPAVQSKAGPLTAARMLHLGRACRPLLSCWPAKAQQQQQQQQQALS
jgi:hypothetical protein